ncbi:FecCD family ABC transporter permease [Niallia sp. 01092]|uniref:FecCD family ABC transporter permease n=1 Tax=unclassified Niallia TaxID=2837522 RepID=UPI003FD30900
MYNQMTKRKVAIPYMVRIGILLLLLISAAYLMIGVGSIYINPVDTALYFAGENQGAAFIVENYRLPRIIIAMLAGSGFAVSGVILQSVIRNPLASPDIVGITKGAGLFAVIIIIFIPSVTTSILPVFSFIGAAFICILLLIISNKIGAESSTIALVGIALGAICQAITEYFLVKYPLQANDSLVWLAGSIWGKSWEEVYGLFPWIIVLLPVSFLLYKQLDILSFDETVSTGLGLKVKQTRYHLLIISVALAGACVAAIGSIGFIGLIAPHIAKRIFGSSHLYLIPGSAIIGALLLVVADGIGRGLNPPVEIPAGIITAIIGVPYFLFLIRHGKKRS